MNLKTFIINAQLAYQFKLLENPKASRTDFLIIHAWSSLDKLDRQARSLAENMITNGRVKLKVKFNGRDVTRAEYLLDSWFTVMNPGLPIPYGAHVIPAEEINRIKETMREIRPLGAM